MSPVVHASREDHTAQRGAGSGMIFLHSSRGNIILYSFVLKKHIHDEIGK
jgi:hypothetical protein